MTQTGHAEQEKLSILLVDDDASDSDLLVLTLRRTDFGGSELRVVHSLSAALQAMEATVPDAVVLDLTLPDAQGRDTVRAVRRAAPLAALVVLSGVPEEETHRACLMEGAQDFLHKRDLTAWQLERALRQSLWRVGWRFSGDGQGTGGLPVSRPARPRWPAEVHRDYARLMEHFLQHLDIGGDAERTALRAMVSSLHAQGAGTRDLKQLHAWALDLAAVDSSPARLNHVVVQGRLFMLEVTGMLLEYYRAQLHPEPPPSAPAQAGGGE